MKPQIENEDGECFDIEDISELQHELTKANERIAELESHVDQQNKASDMLLYMCIYRPD